MDAIDLLEAAIGCYENAVIIIPDGDGYKTLSSMSEEETSNAVKEAVKTYTAA